jgi:hypothetical protein
MNPLTSSDRTCPKAYLNAANPGHPNPFFIPLLTLIPVHDGTRASPGVGANDGTGSKSGPRHGSDVRSAAAVRARGAALRGRAERSGGGGCGRHAPHALGPAAATLSVRVRSSW